MTRLLRQSGATAEACHRQSDLERLGAGPGGALRDPGGNPLQGHLRQPARLFLRLAGAAEGPADLSTRKGFSRNCPSKEVPG